MSCNPRTAAAPRWFALLIGLSTLWFCSGASAAAAGLEGTELSTARGSIGAVVASVFGNMPSSGSGKINSVRVLKDRLETLTVRVSYSDLDTTDLTLVVAALDGQFRHFAAESVKLKNQQGEADVRLELPENVPPKADLRQAFLILQIGDRRGRRAAQLFQCQKVWKKWTADVVIDATPVGKALPPNPPPIMVVFTLQGGPQIVKPRTIEMKPGAAASGAVPKTLTFTPASPAGTRKGFADSFKVTVPTKALEALKTAKLTPVAPGLPPDVTSKQGKGPGDQALSLFDDLVSEPNVSIKSEDVLDLYSLIIQDANKDSGYYYYLPRQYHLAWDDDVGYALRMLYNAGLGDENANTVSVVASLTGGIDPNDLALARELIRGYCDGSSPKLPFTDLRPFPVEARPEIAFQDELRKLYNIDKEKISVVGYTDIAGMIQVGVVTDPVTKENLQLALTQGLGITGGVQFRSAAREGNPQREVLLPLVFRLADRQSFGTRAFQRDTPFQNPTPYPIKLKYVHVLMAETPARVYSYDLKGVTVPVGGTAKIRGIPEWIDDSKQKLKVWVDYALMPDEKTTQKVIDTITAGVTSLVRSEITFRTLTPIQDVGAATILVNVSSRYFDAKGATEAIKPLELAKDGSAYKIAPIFLVNRQPGESKPGDPLFKYKLTVVMADGSKKESKEWTEANDLTLFIGKVQVKPIVDQAP